VKAIRDVVAAAVGFNPDRGDQFVIESLPFESTLALQPPVPETAVPLKPVDKSVNGRMQELLNNKLMLGVGIGAVVIVLAGLVFVVLLVFRKRKPSAHSPAQLPGGTAPAVAAEDVTKKLEEKLAEQNAARIRQELEAISALKLPPVQTKKAEVLAKHINEEAKKDPKVMAQIVRAWINEKAG
jgi:flagellar M-ring protein FliF